jgi:hypothetical protein
MKKLGITTTALAAIAATAILAAGALAGTSKKVAFLAKYAGTATTTVSDNVVAINASGTGTGTPIGRGTISGAGTGDSSQRPCVPFGGTGKLTGTAGTVVIFKVPNNASSCGDEEGHSFAITGHATVTKATGKLKNAKGILKFTGTYDRDAGTFSVKFSGSLTQ